jgi:hypothetical protein
MPEKPAFFTASTANIPWPVCSSGPVSLLLTRTRSLNMMDAGDAGRLYYEQSSRALRTIEDANLRLAEVALAAIS